MKVAVGRQRPSKTVREPARNVCRGYARGTVDAPLILGDPLLYAPGLALALPRLSLRATGNAPLANGWLGPSRIFSLATVTPRRGYSGRGRSAQSGVTQEFLPKWLCEAHPRPLRLAAFVDGTNAGRVDLQLEYTWFAAASK